jgi:putative transposase
VVYNDSLRLRQQSRAADEKISDSEVQRRVITLAKLTPEREWLAGVSSVALVQACNDARRAYRNWFDSLAGRRKGRKVGHPVFRRKHGKQSFRLTRNGFSLHGQRLYVAKVGEIIANPRFLRAKERKLAHAQRALSRKQKDSANRVKARRRVAVLHRKVRETRLDHAHKTALVLVRDSQAVYAEDLAVSGLARTRLAKSVHDAGWAQLLRLIGEKAEQYGRTFHQVGRFTPTSQTCSACSANDGPKPLHVRSWQCKACGVVHDRDVNAARNVLAAGRAERLNACGGTVRPGASLARPSEPGTHRGAA